MSNFIIKIWCTSCGKGIAVEDDYYGEIAGSDILCTSCGARVSVPVRQPGGSPLIGDEQLSDDCADAEPEAGADKTSTGFHGVADRVCAFCGEDIPSRGAFCNICGLEQPHASTAPQSQSAMTSSVDHSDAEFVNLIPLNEADESEEVEIQLPDLSLWQLIADKLLQGRLSNYLHNPSTIIRKRITEASREMDRLQKVFRQRRKDLDHRSSEIAKKYRSEQVSAALKEHDVEELKKVRGVGDKRLQAIRELGIHNFKDLQDNLHKIDQSRRLSDATFVAARDSLHAAQNSAKKHIAQIDISSPDLQRLGELLLSAQAADNKLSAVRAAAGRGQKARSTFPLRGFLRSRLFPAPEENLEELSETYFEAIDSLAELEKLVEPDRYHFEVLSQSDYLRGIGLIEKSLGSAGVGKQGKPDQVTVAWRGLINEDLLSEIENSTLELGAMRNCVLRGYQEFAAKFIVTQRQVFIGDEMGLGKTIEALAAIVHLKSINPGLRVLIVAPASLSENWRREVSDKTDIPCSVVHGNGRYEAFLEWVQRSGIAITSYATLRSDLGRYSHHNIAVDILICDESQYIKNPEAGRSKAVRSLLKSAACVVMMTGTPVENRPAEFIHVLNMLSHGLKKLRGITEANVDDVAPHDFRRLIAPVYLRRNKQDVLHELPELIEVEEWTELSKPELRAHLENLESQMHIMQLRQTVTLGHGSSSSKIDRIVELVGQYHRQNQGVVLFSFFKGVLERLHQEYPDAFMIHGAVSPKERMSRIDQFSERTQQGFGSLILSQIMAGGVGLNMQAASAVILAEPQFNPAVEAQAIARVHRMGQRSSVNVHRVLAKNTIEEPLTQLLAKKIKYMDDYARDSVLKEGSADAVSSAEVEQICGEHRAHLNQLMSASAA